MLELILVQLWLSYQISTTFETGHNYYRFFTLGPPILNTLTVGASSPGLVRARAGSVAWTLLGLQFDKLFHERGLPCRLGFDDVFC